MSPAGVVGSHRLERADWNPSRLQQFGNGAGIGGHVACHSRLSQLVREDAEAGCIVVDDESTMPSSWSLTPTAAKRRSVNRRGARRPRWLATSARW